MISSRTGAGILLAGLLLAGCSTGGASTASPASASGAPTAVVVTAVQNVTYGPVLTGPTGRSLYVRVGVGTGNTPQTCTGACLTSWPALLVTAGGSVTAGEHVPAGTLSTVIRADDNSTQVTYMGLPLYYFTGDAGPGDVTGYGVDGFLLATAPAFLPIATPCQSSCTAQPAPSPSVAPGY